MQGFMFVKPVPGKSEWITQCIYKAKTNIAFLRLKCPVKLVRDVKFISGLRGLLIHLPQLEFLLTCEIC
jgi:hypothetical protein